ncbi:MAG: DUF2892 domain-containing protein [Microbacteriaceae bacterium]|nr:DUF2892 domain-containing protein [Microbacteriaceae bacterium]
MSRERWLAACAVTRGERIARGAVALVLLAAAVSLWPSTAPGAIAAGLGAVLFSVMAITGFCPAKYAAGRPADAAEVAERLREAGIDDARDVVRLR